MRKNKGWQQVIQNYVHGWKNKPVTSTMRGVFCEMVGLSYDRSDPLI